MGLFFAHQYSETAGYGRCLEGRAGFFGGRVGKEFRLLGNGEAPFFFYRFQEFGRSFDAVVRIFTRAVRVSPDCRSSCGYIFGFIGLGWESPPFP